MAKKASKTTVKSPSLLDGMFATPRRKRPAGKKLAVKRSHAYSAMKSGSAK